MDYELLFALVGFILSGALIFAILALAVVWLVLLFTDRQP